MKVLLTGPFGTIGYEVIQALLKAGHEIDCFDLDNKANRKTAKIFGSHINVIWGDITDQKAVSKAVKTVDAIIHNAAIIPPLSEINPVLAHRVNVEGTAHIINAMKNHNPEACLVFPSSISVHGYQQHQEPPRRIHEPFDPQDIYAGHKIECEKMLHESELNWVIVRIGACLDGRTVKGGNDNNTMLQMMFAVAANARVEYIHPRDVALAMSHAISSKAALGKTFFLGGGKDCQTTWCDFVSITPEALGIGKLPSEAFGDNPYYTDWMDTEESQRILQFQTTTLNDFRKELNHKYRFIRPFVAPLKSIIRKQLLKSSPLYGKDA